ncbi:MAG TPA: BTAD domain-containing putative transcriptional regulator, partial [Chthonomonadaceae bacterium]|nr:BTAD domain-containing putative transcriptional regulator [Chthonomonadaceae bacterium]
MPRVRTRSVEWLLALLALRHGRTVDRSWLAGTLWPDSEESQALHNLRDILVHLRKALGSEGVRVQSPTRDTLTLDLEGAEVDVVRFDRAMKVGEEEALRSAVQVYTGPLLEGCLEEWVFAERASREQACLRALETLADAAEQRQEYAEALALLNRAKGMDALHDSARRGLMRVLAASGDTPAALSSYREYRVLLREEMNVEPDAETVRLYQQIRQQAGQPVQRIAPPPEARPSSASSPASSSPLSGLPHQLTALIGREQEARDIADALSRSRLVTLVGGGGVGKTRLGIEVARDRISHSAQRAAFVELASLSDPALLPTFVASALGIREIASPEPAAPTQALIGWLHTYKDLLVLDNCEHLIEAAALLAQTLLEGCPDLHILATSRQRLGLMGEVVWRVPSLPVPEVETLPVDPMDAVAAALTFPAIRLFVERAASAQMGFQLTRREEVEAVCRICRRLDGIPLAIELAAARVASLTVGDIHARLDQRFRLLTGGSRAALPRQQTLRSLIDWSYDLLNAAEQALLCRLSVFAGGWTLEAAEAVCAGGPVEEWETLDLLSSLIDKSLVVAETSNSNRRYRLLETVRQYARDRLWEDGSEPNWRNRHLAFFLALAEEAKSYLTGANQQQWLERLEMEHDNLRQGLTYCLEEPAESEAGLRLAGSLQLFWLVRGYYSEGREYLAALLAHPSAQERTRARADALNAAGALARDQGDSFAARSLYEESLAIRRELGDRRSIAGSLHNLGQVSHSLMDYRTATLLCEEALQINREIGNRLWESFNLIELGSLAWDQGDYASARSLHEQGLAISRELGNKGVIA